MLSWLPSPKVQSSLALLALLWAPAAHGLTNAVYFVLTSSNLTLPVSLWTRLATNQCDSTGHFAFTNALTPGLSQTFYRLVLQ